MANTELCQSNNQAEYSPSCRMHMRSYNLYDVDGTSVGQNRLSAEFGLG
jgi:hypothetical protein